MTPLINQALSLVYTQLSYFSESSNYYQVLSTAFGNNYDRDIAEKLKLHWQQVNFTQIPQIEILDGGILGSAYGAYARETNKIYLSRNFVTNNTAEVIGRVILEEVGHFVDGQLNVEDSEGDEGAIFAELVVGNSLDDQALRKLRTESDFGIITLNGQQVDVEQSGNLPGVYYSSVAWADYNADGKQDFLLTGYSSDFTPIAKLYKNTGNGFKDDTSVSLPGVAASSVAWADYDGDGNQDFLLTGYSSDFTPIAKLYKNTGNGFKEDTSVSLPGVAASSVAWADYDGDGKQDFLLTGSSSSGDIAKLYRNTGNGFREDTNVSLPGVYYSSVAWADYNADGKQDFLLTGSSSSGYIAKLYRNTGNGFKEDTNVSIPGVGVGSVAWADYDGDGNQDFLLTGSSSSGYIAKLYRNTGNGFKEDTNVSLPGVYYSSVAWADYNADGKQDFLLTGYSLDFTPIAKLYRNTGNGFEEDTNVSIPGVGVGSVAWADYDGDGNQDFLLTGLDGSKPITLLVRSKEIFSDVTLAVSPNSVAEDDTNNLVYIFTRTGVISNDLTVNYTIGGTATNGTDYNNIGTSVTFAAGSSTATVTVDPTPDTTVEADETVILTLASGTGYTIGTTSGVTGTITNDDTQVTLAVSPTTVTEDGTNNLVYTFTRAGVISNALTVNYTIGGTATNVSDYGSIGTSVTFAAGFPTATVTVDPTPDTTAEVDETVILTLASGTGYTIGTTSGVTGTITNDDTEVTLAVSPNSVAEDGTNNLVYTFTRTGVTSNALTVNYTIEGTATNGTDYNNIGTSVTFAAGSSTATVTVDPTLDTTVEADETVILTLASGTGYTIGTTSGVTGTITNDDTQVTLAVSPTTVTEDGTNNLVYTFTRAGVISNALTVNYTIGGTATNGSDYGSIGTSVTFAAGSSTATVTVDPTPDTTVEADETVILTLASGTGYTIGTTSGVTGTITNDDTQVTLAVSPTTVTEDGTNNLVYTFTR
ncbi:hypothetical protein CEP14_13325, partial [Cylindrospermopsis raciborskii C04]